jgi:putative membrane protein
MELWLLQAQVAGPAKHYAIFPPLNAALNGISAILILAGHSFIHRKRVGAHRACMISAVITSTLFLVSYLYYHAHTSVIHFRGTGWIRPFYFALLTSHTILAASLVVLVPVTLSFAARERFASHQRIARWTYPIWIYVSFTGVLIYFMVYRWFVS